MNTSADDRARLWNEDGLVDAERADYGSFQVTAWRFKDTTGAYAALARTRRRRSVLEITWSHVQGKCPKDLSQLADAALPHVSHASAPTLNTYLPPKGPDSALGALHLGPGWSEGDAPEIPASGRQLRFRHRRRDWPAIEPRGASMLAVFSFPTPSMARQQLPAVSEDSGCCCEAHRTAGCYRHRAVASHRRSCSTAINYQGGCRRKRETARKAPRTETGKRWARWFGDPQLGGLATGFLLASGLAVGGILRLARGLAIQLLKGR